MLELRKLTTEDIDVVKKWLNQPHVVKWFLNPEDWTKEIREREGAFNFITHFMVFYDNQPIGFCQYYPVSESGEEWPGNYPMNGTYSIDYMIGEEKFIGKKLGKELVKQLTALVFQLVGSERILVQPDSKNTASCTTLLSNNYYFDSEAELYVKNRAKE